MFGDGKRIMTRKERSCEDEKMRIKKLRQEDSENLNAREMFFLRGQQIFHKNRLNLH
jgi:hypothetical protein